MIEGPPEEAYPAWKDLRTHLDSLKTALEKDGLTLIHQGVADPSKNNGGSKAMKLARFTYGLAKSGMEYLFKEEKTDGEVR